MTANDPNATLEFFRAFLTAIVRREETDLSQRQLAVLLTCYMETQAQTVRGLAAALNISKPAVTRALDRLSEFDLIRRKTDPLDRRSVLVQRTASGMNYVRILREEIKRLAEIGVQSMSPEIKPTGRRRTAAATVP